MKDYARIVLILTLLSNLPGLAPEAYGARKPLVMQKLPPPIPFKPDPAPKTVFMKDGRTADQSLPGGEERVWSEIQLHSGFRKSIPKLELPEFLHKRMVFHNFIPVTGESTPGINDFEQKFVALMRNSTIPGATIAIAKNGHLIYARGFGYADLTTKTPMQPETLFRVASISKAVTSITALKLCDKGMLSLDSKPIALLQFKSLDRPELDPNLNKITLKNLLQCTGGWDRAVSGDPMFVPHVKEAALNYSNSLRPTTESIMRQWLSKNLDFLPGTHYAYSNFGYSIVGQAIAKVSKKPYEQVVKEEIFAPMGITRPRLGKTMTLASGETTYYGFPGQESTKSVFPNIRGSVPLPYGGDFAIEAMGPDAGWIMSSVDLVRFASTVAGDGPSPRPISQKSFNEMVAKPDVPEWKDKKTYFAMGWEADFSNGKDKLLLSRQGSLAGVMAFVEHRPDGLTVAYCLNTRPVDISGVHGSLVKLINSSLDLKKSWKDRDLYSHYK